MILDLCLRLIASLGLGIALVAIGLDLIPSDSPVERALGATRLGSLFLRFLDALARIVRDVEGSSSLPANITRE